MPLIRSEALRLLLESAEILHAHGKGPFHERLFLAARKVFQADGHTFEMYDAARTCLAVHGQLPVSETELPEILGRIRQLVPTEHPIFPEIARGEKAPMRLSDFVTHRQFRQRALYHDAFRPSRARFQIAIPVHAASSAGGLTINLWDRDFTDEEMEIAALFGRQVAVAFETDQILCRHETDAGGGSTDGFSPTPRKGPDAARVRGARLAH